MQKKNQEIYLFLFNIAYVFLLTVVFFFNILESNFVVNSICYVVYFTILYYLIVIYEIFTLEKQAIKTLLILMSISLIFFNSVFSVSLNFLFGSVLSEAFFLNLFIQIIITIVMLYLFKQIPISSNEKIVLVGNEENRLFLQGKCLSFIDESKNLNDILQQVDLHGSVTLGNITGDKIKRIIYHCYQNNKPFNVVPDYSKIILNNPKNSICQDTLFFNYEGFSIDVVPKTIKRFMDIIGSFIGIIVASPIFLAIAIAIKVEDGGAVFFTQKRVTKDSKQFTILKFRSMTSSSENSEILLAQENDVRITKIGKIIRALRLDELPQLFNVLLGDMSLVGPRPDLPEYYSIHEADFPEYKLRLKVKAGLTGYAQVYGKYNTSPKNKLSMDLFYINNFSLYKDIFLIIKTVKVLLVKESTAGVAKNVNDNVEAKLCKKGDGV